MINWLYKKYKDQFIKLYLEETKAKGSFKGMEYKFTDSNGLKYYGYTDKMNMSFDRFGKLNEFYTWWSNGLSGEELAELIDLADKALENGLVTMEKGKRVNAIRIGAILNEIRTRKDMVKPMDLVYNILACQIIREDEELSTYNEGIQKEKVKQFKEEPAFFLHMKEFTQLFNSVIMSPEEFIKYAKESEEANRRIMEKLKTL